MRPCASARRRVPRAFDDLDSTARLDLQQLVGDRAHVRAIDDVREGGARTLEPGEALYTGAMQRDLDDPGNCPGPGLEVSSDIRN